MFGYYQLFAKSCLWTYCWPVITAFLSNHVTCCFFPWMSRGFCGMVLFCEMFHIIKEVVVHKWQIIEDIVAYIGILYIWVVLPQICEVYKITRKCRCHQNVWACLSIWRELEVWLGGTMMAITPPEKVNRLFVQFEVHFN